MKILVVNGDQSPSQFIRTLIEGLLKNDHEVALLGKSHKLPFRPIAGTRFKRIVTVFLRANNLRQIFALIVYTLLHARNVREARKYVIHNGTRGTRLKKLVMLCRILRYNPDIIHIQWAMHIEDYVKIILAHRFNILVSLRGTQVSIMPIVRKETAALYRSMFPSVIGFHAVSHEMARQAVALGAREDRIKVIHSPVKDDFIEVIVPARLSDDRIRIISVGRFHWVKGYQYLLDALWELKRSGFLFEMTIVASGPLTEEVLFQLHDLELSDSVNIMHDLRHSEVKRQMRLHDVMVLPSIQEGIANSVLEAMGMGLPVICTDCGGMKEVIRDGLNGWLVPVRNPPAIAEAIRSFAGKTQEERIKIRQRAQATVRDSFGENQNIKSFIQWYEDHLVT